MAGETLKTPELIGGDHLTTNAVAYHNGMVWFQEYQTNRLMVMPLGKPAEATNPGDLKTLSEPVLVRNRHIAFRGEDDKLMLVTCAAPNLHGQLGTETCLSAPSFGGGYLYFQCAGNSLTRAAIGRNERNVLAVGHCTGRPAVREMQPDRVWYPSDAHSSGNSPYLQQIDLATLRQGKNHYCHDGADLCMAPDGQLWLIELGLLSYPWVFTNIYGNNEYGTAGKLQADSIRPCVPHGADRNIYYVFRGDLFRASAIPASTDWAFLAKGCATSPNVQPGFVLYGGADKKIYKLAI
jgi:hypothetical protein